MVDLSLTGIVLIVFLANTIYGLASPFLPPLLEAQGINTSWTGLIFASYAIGVTVSAPIVGSLIDKLGHKKIMATGVLLMAACCGVLSLAKYLEGNNGAIIGAGIGLRFFQGCASAMINTCSYSYAALAYTDNVDKVIALLESTSGIGCVCGPVIGSFVYDLVGF